MSKIKEYINCTINAGFEKQISGIGLSLFRVSFYLILLIEVIQIFLFRDVIFGVDRNSYTILILAWIPILLCLVLGYRTKTAAFLNFCIIIMVLGRFRDFEYHIDYVYLGISLIGLWMPLSNRLSLSNFLEKKKPRSVPVAYYYLATVIGLGFLYLESCFHKIDSKMWLDGLGFWLPTSLPQIAQDVWAPVLNNIWLSKLLGYVTLAFETAFFFAMWFKLARPWLVVVGLCLHLGILIAFPIPLFGAAMIVLYWLVVPDSWLKSIAGSKKVDRYEYGQFDIVSYKWILFFAASMQVMSFLSTPQVRRILPPGEVSKVINDVTSRTLQLRVLSFGMAPHAVFVDDHFTFGFLDYQVDAVAVVGGRRLVKENIIAPYLSGRIWANWMFRLGQFPTTEPATRAQMELYLKHWLRHDGLDLAGDVSFEIRARPFKINRIAWEKDFYAQKAAEPFEVVDRVHFRDAQFNWESKK
ncbi:HTTM domain-containing protein [Bdellovibrio bacteriovorus]|uniref:HTTM domain-containing protein n=1 Tax=Bdellovibrio bacteriovorus str. Tiberius TaxID=1069642 RepID=K7YXB6_BDEBC|nr:HTTM domain-containing protein [Bdellovibrio bacteriovorus]AFY01365.1 HTTM domain-containing protein [Bdellovibrio bacteriovorus str. Tiberius]